MRNKFYITTSIAYVNAPPHIGYALEIIQADVIARLNRLLKKEVYFLSGTDEHGAKIVRSAEKAGISVKKFVDKNAEEYKKLFKSLHISNDNFIRTSDKKQHWPVAQEIWKKLQKAGDIYKKQYQGLYCIGHEAFVTEKDLIDNKCVLHNQPPELIKEENYFFKLSKYQNKIRNIIEKDELRIIPISRKNEVLSFLKEGLEDVSFSRPSKNLSWGIPVPKDPSQTMYVWADALTNYLSGTDQKKWWPADWHLIGKDILRFHALIWPGMLLSAGLKLPKIIAVHGFININGEKMSKTKGNIIDPFELIQNYGSEALRYYLLREIPSTEDGDFTQDKFQNRYNADLVNGLGNLASRIITLGKKTGIKNFKTQENNKFDKELAKIIINFRLNEALAKIWEFIKETDRLIDKEKPWELIESKPIKAKNIVTNLYHRLNKLSLLLEPFLPLTSQKIKTQLKTGKKEILFPRK